MNAVARPRPRGGAMRALVFAFVILGGLAFPAALGGYAAQYAWIAAGGVLLLLTQRLRNRAEAWLLGGIFAVLGLVTAILATDVWQAREYIRAVLFVYLLVVIDEPTRRTVLRLVAIATAIFLTFDFVGLYLLDLGGVKALLYQRGMQGYLDRYWRHVGFLGNPNSSAAFYAMVIVTGTAAVLTGAVRGKVRGLFVTYCMALGVLLMGLTLSRTAMLATAAAVSLMIALRINRLRQLAAGIAFVLVVAAIWLSDAWGIQARFGSPSSLAERISLWRALLGSVTAAGVVIGGWGEAPVVDNDLVYFIHNFGLLGLITNYLVVLILLARLWAANLRTLMTGYLALILLLGAGMGFFADPKFALLIFAGSSLVPRPAPGIVRAFHIGRSAPKKSRDVASHADASTATPT